MEVSGKMGFVNHPERRNLCAPGGNVPWGLGGWDWSGKRDQDGVWGEKGGFEAPVIWDGEAGPKGWVRIDKHNKNGSSIPKASSRGKNWGERAENQGSPSFWGAQGRRGHPQALLPPPDPEAIPNRSRGTQNNPTQAKQIPCFVWFGFFPLSLFRAKKSSNKKF